MQGVRKRDVSTESRINVGDVLVYAGKKPPATAPKGWFRRKVVGFRPDMDFIETARFDDPNTILWIPEKKIVDGLWRKE